MFFKCVRSVIEKAVSSGKYMRNNSSRQKGKKNSTFQYQSFEHNSMKINDQKRLESLE